MDEKLKIAALISGRGTNLQAIINACRLDEYPIEIVAVISNKEDALGLEKAEHAKIPTHFLDHKNFDGREAFDEAMHQIIVASEAKLVVLAGFMRILSEKFITRWENKIINIHPSLLPAFKGLHPHSQAIEAGVRFTGCTVHYVTPEVDSGPIILQAAVPVYPEDDVDSLEERVLIAEHKCYPLALQLIAEGKVTVLDGKATIQNHPLDENFLINPRY